MSVSPPLDGERAARRPFSLVPYRDAMRSRWPNAASMQRLLIILVLWAAVALIYWPSSRALIGFWTDTTDRAYTHGFLVLLIALGLVVRDRARLAAAVIRVQPRALWAVLILSAVWLYCYRAAVQDPQLLLLPLLLWATARAVLGASVARLLIFPIGFLYFAMPVWSDLVAPLQALSIWANSALIWLTGLPAFLTGDLVHLPAGTLEIAGGCSGLHSFVVGIALAALYGELGQDPWPWRLIWVGLMAVFAVIANWVRIFIIVAAAEASDMQTFLVTVDHYWFGWGVFVLCFVGFLWLAARLRPALAAPAGHSEASLGAMRGSLQASWAMLAAALLCLAALPSLALASARLQPAAGPIAVQWPSAPVGWQGPLPARSSDWTPRFENASLVSAQYYLDAHGQAVEVFEAAYREQRQGAKLLGYGNSLLGSENAWRALEQQVEDGAGGAWAQMTVVDAQGRRALIWSRYQVGDHAFVRPRLAQLWYGVAALARPVVSSVTALRARCLPGCAAAHQRLIELAARLPPVARFDDASSSARQGEFP